MRILHVVPSFHPARVYGGPIVSTLRLCESLADLGCDVRVLTTDANGPRDTLDLDTSAETLLRPGLRVRYAHRLAVHSVSPALLRVLGERLRWAEVVHLTAVYSFPTLPTLAGCRALRRPLVWSPRGSLQRWDRSTRVAAKAFYERLALGLAPRSAVLHVTSDAEAEASRQRMARLETRTIPNGIDLPPHVSHRQDDRLRLLFLGRLHPIKAIDSLLEACARLRLGPSRPWVLRIAGEGEPAYERSLRALATSLGIEARVEFLGTVHGDAKAALLEDTDLLVLPSHSENFGMVVVEALAHAVPVVAARGTPWRGLEDVGCGAWVENDPQSLEAGITRLAAAPLTELGQRGRAWVEREMSWSKVARDFLALYRSVSPLSSSR